MYTQCFWYIILLIYCSRSWNFIPFYGKVLLLTTVLPLLALVNSPTQCLDLSLLPQKYNRRGPSPRNRLPLRNLTDEYHQDASLVTNFRNYYGVIISSYLSPCRKTTEAKSQLKASFLRRRWEEERVCQINYLMHQSGTAQGTHMQYTQSWERGPDSRIVSLQLS